MTKTVIYFLLFAFLALPLRANDDRGVAAIFETANAAYDAGDFAGALRHYNELLKRSPGSAEAWYNAANAAFRGGQTGVAILYYRRGWYVRPQDADIAANLQLAQQRTGALMPSLQLVDHAAQELSHKHWKQLFTAGYSALIASVVLIIFLPGFRRFTKPLALTALAVAIAGFAGWFYWQQWIRKNEAVVIAEGQTARYEPREQATRFFDVPEGSIVYVEEAFDQWQKISAGDKSGWVPSTALRQVNTWNPEDIN